MSLLDVSLYDEQAQACYLDPSCISALGKSVHRRIQKVLATFTGNYLKKKEEEQKFRFWLYLLW